MCDANNGNNPTTLDLMNLINEQSKVIGSLQKTIESLNVTIKNLNDKVEKFERMERMERNEASEESGNVDMINVNVTTSSKVHPNSNPRSSHLMQVH